MAKMILMVLDNIDKLEDVVCAWREAGANGVTILESSGGARLLGYSGARDDLPIFPGLRNLLTHQAVHHRTLFSVVDDEVDLAAFFAATEAVVGPLDQPNTGIMVVLPVLATHGVKKLP